jgi:hypothetical protein
LTFVRWVRLYAHFARFKVRMLGAQDVEFRVFGVPGSRAELLTRLDSAQDWVALFRAIAVPSAEELL